MLKRAMSFILALVLTAGMIPTTVFAQEETEPSITVQNESEPERTEPAPTDPEIHDAEEEVFLTMLHASEEENTGAGNGVYETGEVSRNPFPETDLPYAAGGETIRPLADAPISGTWGDNLTWVLDTEGELTVSGEGPMKDGAPNWRDYSDRITSVVIRSGVTTIGSYAFTYCRGMTRVEIPDTVTSIGLRAFYECDSLDNVKIPGSIPNVGSNSFVHCDSLTTVELGNGVTVIEEAAFLYCENLVDINLPDSLTTIGICAFQGCSSLPNLEIPASVTTIEQGAFSYCTSMTKMVIPDTVTTLGGEVFWQCTNLQEVVLPKGLREISDYMFSNCEKLEKVGFPEGLIILGENVFVCCYGLTEMDLPDTVTAIGQGVFWCCENLQKVGLPENLESIGTSAFYNCLSLTEVHFPGRVSSIAGGVFVACDHLLTITVDPANTYYCNDDQGVLYNKSKTELVAYPPARGGEYVIPDTVTAIGEDAFNRAVVTRVEIPDSVTSIGDYAFFACKDLTEVKLPKYLSAAGRDAFAYIGRVGTVEIPGSLKIVSSSMFAYSGVEKVVLLEGVTTIGSYAFNSCSNLLEVVLPSTLTRIEDRAFGSCKSLKRVYFQGDVPETDEWVFKSSMGYHMETTLYFRADNLTWTEEAMAALEKDNDGIIGFRKFMTYDDRYIDHGECGDTVKWALKKDGTLLFFTMDENAESDYLEGTMDTYAPGRQPWSIYLNEIRSICVLEGVLNISGNAFSGCEKLTQVSLAHTVADIGSYAFSDCSALEKVELAEGIETIGAGAFADCAKLKTFSVPASVTQIGAGFLAGCTGLEKVEVAEGSRNFSSDSEGVFFNKSMSRLILVPARVTGTYYAPQNLQKVDDYAFSLCARLTEVVFQGSCPTFGDKTFAGATLKAYYPVDNGTWLEERMQNFGGKITWIALDDTLYFGADVQICDRTENLTIRILPKSSWSEIGGSPVKRPLKAVTMHSILGETEYEAGKTEFVIPQEMAAQQDIVLKREGYRDFVIPKAVSASFAAKGISGTPVSYELMAYMKKVESNEPYVSTVFGREYGSGDAYVELRNTEMNLEEGSRHDIIVTVVGGGSGMTYYIGQDEAHRVSSYNGVFSYTDLYTKLDFGKKVYAYAVTSDGVVVEPAELCINKMQPPSQAAKDFLAGSSFSLLGKDGQVIDIPESIPLVGGGKISLEAFQFPIGVDVNGSNVRISFGVDIFTKEQEYDEKYQKGKWFDFKDSISHLKGNLKKAGEELAIFQTFKEKFSDEYSGYYENKSNFKVDFLGYAEAEIINGEIVFKEILFNFGGEFMFHYTLQGAIWVIPAYFYVEAGAELDVAVNRARFLADRAIPLQLEAQLDFKPKLKAGGGAGVKNAVSAGIWGEGSLPFTWNFSDQYHTMRVAGEFGAEAEFVVLKTDVVLLSGEFTLWEKYYGSTKSVMSPVRQILISALSAETKNTVSLVSRDYVADTSSWMGENTVSLLSTEATVTDFRKLQENVFNRSQPQIAELGDGMIMVWVEDDITRDTYNRMRLVYSCYDETTGWSQPQSVWDDGHNDVYPSLVSDGTQVYVAWQKINKTLTAQDCTGIDSLLQSSEIFLAEFDSTTMSFLPARQLTDDARYEYNPVVILDDGSPVVYYVAVAPDQINQAKSHTLCRYTTKESAKKTKLNYILSVAAKDGNLGYVMDVDGDLSTTADINAYSVGSYITSAFNKVDDRQPYLYAAYGELEGEDILFVSDMTNIYYRANYKTNRVFESGRSIAGDLTLLDGESGPIFLWTETEGDGLEFYMSTYEGGTWSQPVQVSRQGAALRDVSAIIRDGKIVGVCNTDSARDTTDLVYFQLSDFADLALVDYFFFDESSVIPGETKTFDVMFRNQGTERIDEVTFTVTDTLGTEYSLTRTLYLEPGAFGTATVEYPVPLNYTGTTLKVTAEIAGIRDADPANNTASLAVGKPDLMLLEQSVHKVEGGYAVNVSVENVSAVVATDVTLSVKPEEEGTPVFTRAVGDLNRAAYASVNVGIPEDQLVFDGDGIARVYLTVESSREDAAEADNRLCVLIVRAEEKQCAHAAVETLPGKDPDCENPGYTSWQQCAACGQKLTESELLFKLEHDMGQWAETKAPTCTEDGIKVRTCLRDGCEHTETGTVKAVGHTYTDVVTAPTCTAKGYTTHTCSCGSSYSDTYTEPLKHSYQNGSCIRCGAADPDSTEEEGVIRIFGATRYDTAIAIAEQLKKNLGVSKFNAIVVASGTDFADALPGAYLANQKGAPVLLVRNRNQELTLVKNYIKANLAPGGTVYILGGEKAVPKAMETGLDGFTVKRLGGATRYETNLLILKEGGVKVGDDILVCTGKDFPDSLAASAVNKPILLVKDSLNASQTAFLNSVKGGKLYIIGGTAAVNARIENALKTYGTTQRLSGATRYYTSVEIAKTFFPNTKKAILAYGENFPDGMCGGTLAYSMGAPVLLTTNSKSAASVAYTTGNGIHSGAVLGGTTLISDMTVMKVFG